MHSGGRWRLGRRPALDGLRAVAVLLVVAYHLFDAAFPTGGIVGVTTFFVLSGFLITSLLLEERAGTGQVDLVAFYRRRALRLVPALAVMLLVVGPFAIAIGNISFADLVAVVGYSANWWAATGHTLGMLTHTWTLASEEQFYLLWPVALLLVRRTRHAAVVTVGAAGVLLVSGVLGAAGSSAAILAGCGLALALHGRRNVRPVPAGVVPVLLAGLVAVSWLALPVTLSVVATTTVAAGIVYAIASGAQAPLLTSTIARAIGARSYGVYLWHLPVIFVVSSSTGMSRWLVAVAALPALAVVVEASWRYVEQPFMRRRAQVPARLEPALT